MIKNISKYIFTISLATLFVINISSISFAFEHETFTLQSAIDRALFENPATHSAELDVEAAEYRVRSAYGSFTPTVSAEYGYGYAIDFTPTPSTFDMIDIYNGISYTAPAETHIAGHSWSIQAAQPIFTGFALLNALDLSQLGLEASEMAMEQTDRALLTSVQNAFISYLANEETIKSTIRAIERAQEQLAYIQASYDLGLRPELDVLQAEVELASFENTLVQVQNRRDISLTQLRTLLALPISSEAEFIGALQVVEFDKTFEECLESAMQNRLDLELSRLAVSMAETGRRITDAAFYPTIAITAGYTEFGTGVFDRPGLDREFSVALGFTWKIFDGTRRYNDSQIARLEVSGARNDLMAAMDQAAGEVESLYASVIEAGRSIEITDKAVSLAEEAYRAALTSYELGIATNLDLLSALASLSEQEANNTAALAGYLIALSSLYMAIGEVQVLGL